MVFKSLPLTFVTSALITKDVSHSCCLNKHVCEGSARTRDCFSDTSTKNCLSAPVDSSDVGDCLLVVDNPFVGVPAKHTRYIRLCVCTGVRSELIILILDRSLSSFQASKVVASRLPLQSRNDMHRIAPFSLNIVPDGLTDTGSDFLASLLPVGRFNAMLIMEPRLVPTHSAGFTDESGNGKTRF